jgi:hypothetical protein
MMSKQTEKQELEHSTMGSGTTAAAQGLRHSEASAADKQHVTQFEAHAVVTHLLSLLPP